MRGDRRSIGMRRGLVVLALMVMGSLVGGTAHAAPRNQIDVFPGNNAITTALAQANPGDTLLIHTGTYPEVVDVNVAQVTLKAAGDGPVTVDGQCQGNTINVHTNGVLIDGLQVVGGDFRNVNFTFVSNGGIINSRLMATCPDPEYGINLYQTGPMLIRNNYATGFTDAGIYIGAITDTGSGAIITRGNNLVRNNRGIIVEDSVGVSIQLISNRARNNFSDGIFLHASDGIQVMGNWTTNNREDGIELDPDSDGNLVAKNSSRGNDGFDLANDGGSGNCFSNNRYETSSGSITC